jgi:hypothetical protein
MPTDKKKKKLLIKQEQKDMYIGVFAKKEW